VHQDWREGFLHFLEAGEGISEKDLLDAGAWGQEARLNTIYAECSGPGGLQLTEFLAEKR
jgi:hypothetical protein